MVTLLCIKKSANRYFVLLAFNAVIRVGAAVGIYYGSLCYQFKLNRFSEIFDFVIINIGHFGISKNGYYCKKKKDYIHCSSRKVELFNDGRRIKFTVGGVYWNTIPPVF